MKIPTNIAAIRVTKLDKDGQPIGRPVFVAADGPYAVEYWVRPPDGALADSTYHLAGGQMPEDGQPLPAPPEHTPTPRPVLPAREDDLRTSSYPRMSADN